MPETSEKKDVKQGKTGWTNWMVFAKAGLVPKEVICQAYKPMQMADMSCHTRLPLSISTINEHIKAEHGSGFLFRLRKGDAEWPGWKQFAESGLELHDLRCDVCDAEIPLSVPRILTHLRPHAGKTRRVKDGGDYLLTINPEKPVSAEDVEVI